MSRDVLLRRVRPCLFTAFTRSRLGAVGTFARRSSTNATLDYEKRIAQLKADRELAQCYPRLPAAFSQSRIDKDTFSSRYGYLKPKESHLDDQVILAGRIRSFRTAGSKLCFLDIEARDGGTVQAFCQLDKFDDPAVTAASFKDFCRIARKGDSYTIQGYPHRTERGELSVLATALPKLLSPSLHQIPEVLDDAEARARQRHVHMLVNPAAIQTLQVRHEIERCMQDFFNQRGFVKVTTPIVAASAGGALARPFETEATELIGDKLTLRIAPELWLKRLIVGGMERVYEMGPAFRNEGADLTHNPEFNLCEFYQAFASLDELTSMTEALYLRIFEAICQSSRFGQHHDVPAVLAPLAAGFKSSTDLLVDALAKPQVDFTTPFQQIEFIPALEELGCALPDLESPAAFQTVLEIFNQHGDIAVPGNPTLPRLLDALAAHYLEPLSNAKPTFITHHPGCMSPLSKHFTCPKTNQIVAARAELFINAREYANMYEEENSPFGQRRKFEQQLKQREVDSEAMEVDESYLQALEWACRQRVVGDAVSIAW